VDVQFAMVCDQRFVAPTMATMLSVIAQIGDRGSIRFVILGDGLTPAHAARFREVELTPYDVEVRVHDVTSDLDRDVGTEDAKRATFGRIYLIDHLPPQRTIYLDGDILATRDFTELFHLDLQGACLAGVTDSAALRLEANPAGVPIEQRMRLVGITHGDPSDYLNGGVLIFDLDNPDFQRLALEARSLVVTRGRSLKQRDQDAMNLAFAGRKHRLPNTYNYMTQFYVSDRCVDGDLPAVKYGHADASLIHFSGAVKPWENAEAEFYNGLYRRLVHEAEEQLGVTSGLYFSLPARSPREAWSPQRWADVLGAPDRPMRDAERTPELELVDITADGVYLRIPTDLLRLATEQDLALRLESRGQELASLPLSGLSAPLARLLSSTRPGVRRLSLDLDAVLAAGVGIARDVELTLTAPHRVDGFSRWVAGTRLLAGPSAATAGLMEELGVDAAVTEVVDGVLSGWCDTETLGQRPRLSLHVAGELVAWLRLEPDEGDHPRATFAFPVANLVGRGYPADAPVTVRVPATNVPVPGPHVTIGMLGELPSGRSVASAEPETRRTRPRPRSRWRRGSEGQ
jgi:lipopolysaccharide biosynthesis glycosyltransferase